METLSRLSFLAPLFLIIALLILAQTASSQELANNENAIVFLPPTPDLPGLSGEYFSQQRQLQEKLWREKSLNKKARNQAEPDSSTVNQQFTDCSLIKQANWDDWLDIYDPPFDENGQPLLSAQCAQNKHLFLANLGDPENPRLIIYSRIYVERPDTATSGLYTEKKLECPSGQIDENWCLMTAFGVIKGTKPEEAIDTSDPKHPVFFAGYTCEVFSYGVVCPVYWQRQGASAPRH